MVVVAVGLSIAQAQPLGQAPATVNPVVVVVVVGVAITAIYLISWDWVLLGGLLMVPPRDLPSASLPTPQ